MTTLNYNTIANLHTLQITTAHKVLSVCYIFTSHLLITASNSIDFSASMLLRCILAPICTKSSLQRLPYSSYLFKSKSKLCYDQWSVGQSILVSSTHLGLTTRFLLLSDSCEFVDVGRAQTREWVCHLQLLLVLASTVILGS
jgi:hypothetical protein